MTRTYRPGWFSRSLDVRDLQTDAPATTTESAGFLEAFGVRWRETFTGELASDLLKPGFSPTPNYIPSRVDLDAVTEGIDEDLWYKYGRAQSSDQLYSIYVDNIAKMDRRRTLASAGWTSIPAAILADTLDPTTLAINALTGGIGSAVGATRVARLATYAKAGVAAGVPMALTEAYRASVNPDIKPTDVVLAGLGGAGAGVGATVAGVKNMGAIGSALTVGAASAAPVAAMVPFTEQDDRDAVIGISSAFLLGAFAGGVGPALRSKMEPALRWTLESEQVAEIGVNNLTPKGREAFPMALDERANVQRETRAIESVTSLDANPETYVASMQSANTPDPRVLNEAIAAEAERIAPIQSAMGSAAANELRGVGNTARLDSLKIGDFDPSFIDDAKPWAGNVRRWTTLQAINVTLGNADNPIVRRAGNMLAFDGIAKKNGRIYEAADQWANARSEAMVAPLFYQLEQAYKSHRSGGGELTYAEFREAVTKAKRRGGVGYENVPGVNEGMNATISTFNEAFDVMARHNVRGADDFNRLDNYVTRRWRRDAIESATKRSVTADGRTTMLGESGVLEALAASIARKNDWANEKQLAAMARSIFVNGGRRGQHRASLGFLEGSIDEIVADLVDSGVKQDLADSIGERLRRQAAPKDDAKNPPILKHRIELDETYQHPLADGSVLAIEDLLENDIALIAKGYVRRAHGNAVAAQTLRSMSDDPAVPLSSFDALASRVREKGREMGQNDSTIDWDIARLETAWRNAVGIPQQTDTKWVRTTRAARIMRNGLRTTMLGNFYNRIQNAVEPLSSIAPDIGKVVTRYMDVLPDFTARAVDGKLSNANLRIYEYMSGRGVSNLVDGTHVTAPTLDSGIDRVLSSIEAKADRWTYMVDKYTGQTMTNDFGYRVVGDVNIHQVVEWATSGKRPPAAQMRAFGFTDEIWERIAAQINEHKVAVPGPETNGKVKLWDPNVEKWKDLEAFSAFSAGVNAVTRSWFVNPTGNELPWLVNNELGKALTQFRTFSLASSDAKIAKSIQTRDPKTIVRFAAGTGLMYVAYTMKVYVDSLGRPDAEEYRRERLDPKKAWMIAVSRSAYSSLIPAAIDTARSIVREDPLFAAGRASNIKGGGIASIPLVDWFNNTLDAGGGVIRATYDDDYDFSMQNLNALRRSALFLPQVEPLVKGIEYLGRDVLNLPEKSRER